MTAVVIALLAVFASLFAVFAVLRASSRKPGTDGDTSSGAFFEDPRTGDAPGNGGSDGGGDGGGGD
jgi:hypothetical protein